MTGAAGPTGAAVYLVGAGPGDPGLITVKGLRVLREADVVVYDRLGAPALLRECPPAAELVYVGKGPGSHARSQEDINRLLVDRGRRGLRVVRLKGGDPFVFGRGGEEALALAEAGVPFEVVPGVSSAIAVAAYAGVPLTFRGLSSSIGIITGHEDPDKGYSAINWRQLATGVDTLVVLMGVRHLETITTRLLAHGRPPDAPALIVSRGTRGGQLSLKGTLADISARARAGGVCSPAVIVIGEVVRLHERLQWFERRPLSGRRVLVTRMRDQAATLSRLIADCGGEPVEIPLIETVPPEDWAPLDRVIAQLPSYRWLVLTSANGMKFFFRRLEELGLDARALAGVRVACVGEATAAALRARGLLADLTPSQFLGKALVEPLIAGSAPGDRVLMPRGDLAADDLPSGLREAGLHVDDVVAYRTVPAAGEAGGLERLLVAGGLDAITFASSSAVRNLHDVLGGQTLAYLGETVIACIGPSTAETARALGLPVHVEARRHTIEGLVDALAAHYAGMSRASRPQK